MYVVRSMKLANYLMQQGFCIVSVEQDYKNPQYNVFKFLDCPKLREQITKWTELKHKNLV